MADYTITTDFGDKDALTSGDPLKRIKGTEVDTELSAIAVAIATKYDSNDIASSGQATAESDNTVLMTPLRVANWADANGGIVGDLQALADPAAHTLLAWNNTSNAAVAATVGSGLSFDGTTLTATGGSTGWTTELIKAADTSRVNNTVAADPDLTYTIPSTGVYEVELVVNIRSVNTTPDARGLLVFTGTTTPSHASNTQYASWAPSTGVGGTVNLPFNDSTAATPATWATSAGTLCYVGRHIFEATVVGDLSFAWAQNVTDAGNATTVAKGSVMRVRKLI